MQKKSLNSLSLRLKTITGVIILIACTATFLTLAYINHEKAILQNKLEKLGLALSRNLAFNAELGVLSSNRETLVELIEGVLAENEVLYAAIFSSKGELLAYNERNKDASNFFFKKEVSERKSFPKETTVEYYRHLEEPICSITAPVKLLRKEKWIEGGLIAIPETQTELIGKAVVGLSLHSLSSNLAQIKWLALKFTSLTIAIAALVTFFLVSLLTNPIKKLREAIREVSRGNLSVQLKTVSPDEVGELTVAFNQMVKEIKESRDKIENTARELARLNNEMEDILHIVSHDLRSPLINIQGFTQRLEPIFQETTSSLGELLKGDLDKAVKAKLEEAKVKLEEQFPVSMDFISKGVRKMDSLLTSLLAISRVGRKADPIELNDLNHILEEILLVFDHQIKQKGITIVKNTLPLVLCRANEINQVFSNLISNAIAYMRLDSSKTIEIGYTVTMDAYQFYVKDTGIGIYEQDYERIFQIFTRLSEVDVPGEGVGLAYVRKIIRSHHGKIWIESKKGVGSTFFFTLPK